MKQISVACCVINIWYNILHFFIYLFGSTPLKILPFLFWALLMNTVFRVHFEMEGNREITKRRIFRGGRKFFACVTKWNMGRGSKNRPKKCHVLFEWPLTSFDVLLPFLMLFSMLRTFYDLFECPAWVSQCFLIRCNRPGYRLRKATF
jgi:hypothetical protein